MQEPEKYLKQKPVPWSVLYLDMNSFFASVEQYHDPQLRKRPVGVSAGLSSGATVIAASIEAKRYGVVTGTKVAEARQKCPEIVLIEGHHGLYKQAHQDFMSILHNTPCCVRARGIDEAFALIPSYLRSKKASLSLARSVKSQLYNRYNEHILCSMGIASNIWLAKMAASSKKPDGLVLINQNLVEFYKKLQLTDLNGISYGLAKRLYGAGIYTPLGLFRASYKQLSKLLGVNGAKWYLRLQGIEVDFELPKPQKSLGHQVTTVPNSPSSNEQITTFCIRIITILGERLRKKQLAATSLAIYIRFDDGSGWVNDLKKLKAIQDDRSLISVTIMLLKKLRVQRPTRKIIMTLSGLVPTWQLSFDLDSGSDRSDKISQVTDQLNQKFGQDAIMPARSFFYRSVKLDRVGFGGDLVKNSHLDNII